MEILGYTTVDDRHKDSCKTECHYLDGGRVFGRETERGRILVVDLVNTFIERTPVKGSMRPVVPCVFDDKEDGNLITDLPYRRKWDARFEAEVLGHGVEEPDLRELDSKVREKDELGAVPLISSGGHFLLDRS